MKKILSFGMAVIMAMSSLSFVYGESNEDNYSVELLQGEIVGRVVSIEGGSVRFDEETGTITGYVSGKSLVIPSEINGVSVTSIGDSAFYNCSSLRSISIPESVSYISLYAFNGCRSSVKIICSSENSYAYSVRNSDIYPSRATVIYKNADGTINAEIGAQQVLSVNTGEEIKADTEFNSLMIEPMIGIEKGSYVYITINNGSFDESLIEECRFKSEYYGYDWDDLISLAEAAGGSSSVYNTILKQWVHDQTSRYIPYNLEYVDPTTLKVELCPLSDEDTGLAVNDVADGIPVYNIKLPVIAGSETGTITVSVDRGNSTIQSCENIVYAYNNGYVLSDDEYEKNDYIWAEREINTEAGEAILYNDEPNALIIKPVTEVSKGDSIIIKIKNGSFDESLIENCKYISPRDGRTGWDELISMAEMSGGSSKEYTIILLEHVKASMSREVPYNIEYIDSSTIRVYLYPIDDTDVNTSSSNAADGVALYRIELPAVAGSEDGYVQVAVDGGNTTIENGGWYTIARINAEPEYSVSSTAYVNGKCIVGANSQVVNNGTPVSIVIKPTSGIGTGESILIHIKNGSFDESRIEEYKYKAPADGTSTFDDLVSQAEAKGGTLSNYAYVSTQYVRNAQSRELPYKLEYIDSSTLMAELYPISNRDADSIISDCTEGIAIYNISLPIVSGEYDGDVEVAIDGNGTSIQTSGWYSVATVEGGEDITEDVIGDLTSDGKVTTTDALVAARLAIGQIDNEELLSKCDYNNDGKVTVTDALVLARYAIGEIDTLN